MDWPLEYRTEEQLLAIAPEASDAKSSICVDETGAQMFLRIDRAA
jgi:hypothetical protein